MVLIGHIVTYWLVLVSKDSHSPKGPSEYKHVQTVFFFNRSNENA